jgi:alkylated DNA repair dioxygenase AlkB
MGDVSTPIIVTPTGRAGNTGTSRLKPNRIAWVIKQPNPMKNVDEAIDFRKLYLQEKQKALRRRKEEKQRATAVAATGIIPSSPNTACAEEDDGDSETQQEDLINAAVSTNDDPNSTAAVFALQFSPLSVNALCRRHDRVASTTGVFYKSRFLADRAFQTELIRWLQGLPANNNKIIKNSHADQQDEELQALGKWTFLPHAQRRVALFDARRQSLPAPLQIIVDAVTPYFGAAAAGGDDDDDVVLAPNHLLINEYEPHQGIMAHTDGPAYAARTATISLGNGSVLLQFRPGDIMDDQHPQDHQNNKFQIVLEGHGSLVLFEDEAYSSLNHSIDEHCTVEYADSTCRNADEGTVVRRDYRISITIRHMY